MLTYLCSSSEFRSYWTSPFFLSPMSLLARLGARCLVAPEVDLLSCCVFMKFLACFGNRLSSGSSFCIDSSTISLDACSCVKYAFCPFYINRCPLALLENDRDSESEASFCILSRLCRLAPLLYYGGDSFSLKLSSSFKKCCRGLCFCVASSADFLP